MCGIFGVVNFGTAKAAMPGERIARAFARTALRGPDGADLRLFASEGVGAPRSVAGSAPFELAPGQSVLGHHRLAIVDVIDQANQPMSNEDGTVWVVFNGEIYNAPTLRRELASRGHVFRTESSDTEAIVHGWEEWGRALTSHLTGIFAISVLDLKAGELVLLRDFPGTKPLYYALTPEFAAFGSTARSVVDLLPARSLDPSSVAHWMTFGYSSVDRSLFAGVHKIEPGTGLSIALKTGKSQRFDFRPLLEFGSKPFAKDEFEQIFSEVMREQMHADVPVGFYLSGGVDSSLVAAYARRLFPSRALTCFSMRFATHDESPYSAAVARSLRLEQHIIDAPALGLASIAEMVAAMDEPLSDPSFFSTWHLSKAIGRSVKVCIGGDGGDELFSGYERYQWALRAQRRARRWPLLARATAAGFGRLVGAGRAGRRVVATLGAPLQVSLALETIGLARLAPPAERAKILAQVSRKRPPTEAGLLQLLQVDDLQAPLSEDILFKVDRTSMANHFEARVPFLDQRVVRYALSRSLAGNVSSEETKIPLRRLSADLGIAALLNPKKQGFGLDLAAGHPLIAAALADAGGAARTAEVLGLPARFEQRVRRPMSLWALLVFELWLAENLKS